MFIVVLRMKYKIGFYNMCNFLCWCRIEGERRRHVTLLRTGWIRRDVHARLYYFGLSACFPSYIPFHSWPCMRQYAILNLQNAPRDGTVWGSAPVVQMWAKEENANQREQQWAIFNLTKLLRLNEQTLPYCCEYTFHYSLGWAFRWACRTCGKQTKANSNSSSGEYLRWSQKSQRKWINESS